MGICCAGSEYIFTDYNTAGRSVGFFFICILFCVAQIPYGMALSTFFTDEKLAGQVGLPLLFFPIVLFLLLAQRTASGLWGIYFVYWLPIMPTGVLLVKYTQVPKAHDIYDTNFFDVSSMSEPVAWVCLVLSIPLWLCIYYYLDCVIPNSYGIQLHPCFCFHKSPDQDRRATYQRKVDDEAANAKIYDEKDPILIDCLTKKFGSLIAVNNLKLSIR